MRVMVAMSGGVDSSVAASLVRDAGHETVGVTLKLWGGPSDRGCCSVSDVEDARRVAQQLGIRHHVFNFTDIFEQSVVDPYVAAHAAGYTPNPCIECNRHVKFDALLDRAGRLGFDAVATGHHARISRDKAVWALRRGADPAKDQSYVLHMLGQTQLSRLLLPVGEMDKSEVRRRAESMGLRTANKPDSQDVCFISGSGGRRAFLEGRIPLHPGRLVDEDGTTVGQVDAVELLTTGQRRGLGPVGGRYVLRTDPATATAFVGDLERLLTREIPVGPSTWVAGPPEPDEELEVQVSAHGRPFPGHYQDGLVVASEPVRRVAAGQSVVLYRADTVVGGAIAR